MKKYIRATTDGSKDWSNWIDKFCEFRDLDNVEHLATTNSKYGIANLYGAGPLGPNKYFFYILTDNISFYTITPSRGAAAVRYDYDLDSEADSISWFYSDILPNYPEFAKFFAMSDTKDVLIKGKSLIKVLDPNLSILDLSDTNINNISARVAEYNTSLQQVILPDTVEIIRSEAFNKCTNLSNINFPLSLHEIGSYALSECAFKSLNIPNSVNSIKDGAFSRNNKLTKVRLSGKLPTLSTSLFDSCYNLQSVIIPKSVTTINTHAFYRCSSLTDIDISNVARIGVGAFYGCYNLPEDIKSYIRTINPGAFSDRYDINKSQYGAKGLDPKVIAADASTDPDELANLARSSSDRCRYAVASNICTSDETLNILAGDDNPSVRGAVAKNPSTPAYILEDLSTDDNYFIRCAVAMNIHTPEEVLIQMLEDLDSTVRKLAEDNLNKQGIKWKDT